MSDEKIAYIGMKKEDKYPLSSHIYGHRFMQGQDFREYLLEFLCVLIGTNYSFKDRTEEEEWKYEVYKKIGLRRFVFYANEHKSPYDGDKIALEKTEEILERHLSGGTPEQIRELFRSYLAVEDDRSWFAKSLFPVHKDLLFAEALRKGITTGRLEYIQNTDPDKGIEFTGHYFFARGGELYFLMLVAGTQHDLAMQDRISTRIKFLLEGHHKQIGEIAKLIDEIWKKAKYEITKSYQSNDKDKYHLEVGWLPDSQCKLYREIAIDVDKLLKNELNQLEMLHLLNYLIGIHLLQYLYRRSHQNCNHFKSCGFNQENFIQCRPIILIDAIENKKENEAIRNLSSRLFRQLDDSQAMKAQDYIYKTLKTWLDNGTLPNGFSEKIKRKFNLNNKENSKNKKNQKKNSKNITIESIDKLISQWEKEKAVESFEEDNKYINEISSLIYKFYENNLSKHALGVHRKLARQTGMLQPKTSQYQRWTVPDSVLRTLVLCNLEPGENQTIDEFVSLLWYRYGIVIGPREALESGLSNEPIDNYHFDKNLQYFQEKLLKAGLAVQYSDATCLVENPFPLAKLQQEVFI